jgi:AraC-like DNA-binding protein
MMKYLECKPIDPLSEYIQLIWIAESESPDDHYPKEKILPDGIVEVVFHYYEPLITYLANGKKFIQPKGFAVSQMRKFIEIESNGKVGFVSVRFYPWGAHLFFKEPIKNFLDSTIDIKYLWKDEYRDIHNQLETFNDEEKVNRVQQFLIMQFEKNRTDKIQINDAIKLIRDTKGQLSIDELCENLNLSYKQLERIFLATIGTTPKVFSRTTRFLHLCHHLKEYEDKTMTQLTYDLGYYDQSHFIKEFKEFSGLTPKEYFEHKNISFADF